MKANNIRDVAAMVRDRRKELGWTNIRHFPEPATVALPRIANELLAFLNGLGPGPDTKTKIFHENAARSLVDPDHYPAYPTPLKLG